MILKKLNITLLALGLSAGLLHAQSSANAERFYFHVKPGVEFGVGEDLFHRSIGFDASPLIGLAPGSAQALVGSRDYGDVYGSWISVYGEAGYKVTDTIDAFIAIGHSRADSETLTVGTVTAGPDTFTLGADFGNYSDVHFDFGGRYNFEISERLTANVSGSFGLRRVNEIEATFFVPGVNFVSPFDDALTELPFYDQSTVFAFGAKAGLLYTFDNGIEVGVDAGLGRQTGSDDDDTTLDVLGIGRLNDVGGLTRFSVSLRLGSSF